MTELVLDPLTGTNPLGLLAALGALDVATRTAPERTTTLRWTDELVPRAVLRGPQDVDELVHWVDADRLQWQRSAVLSGPSGTALSDIKPSPDQLHAWAGELAENGTRAETDLFAALLAEGAVAGKGDAKPTSLHFTAGQQQFLTMVRELAEKVDAKAIVAALRGPWRYASTLPTLSWDVRGQRVYALRGFNPVGDKRTGEPGADWLAFLALTFFPVAAIGRGLETACCEGGWKNQSFVWPLWSVPIGAPVVRSLLMDARVRSQAEPERLLRGVIRLYRAPIRRTEQGGYGSFTAPEPVLGTGFRQSGTRRRSTSDQLV